MRLLLEAGLGVEQGDYAVVDLALGVVVRQVGVEHQCGGVEAGDPGSSDIGSRLCR